MLDDRIIARLRLRLCLKESMVRCLDRLGDAQLLLQSLDLSEQVVFAFLVRELRLANVIFERFNLTA